MRGAFWWVRNTAKLNRNQNQKGLNEERMFCHKMETHRPCWIWGFGWSPEFAPSLLLPVTTPSQSYPRARAKHLISPASSVEKWSCPDDSGRKVLPQTLMVQLVPWTNYQGEGGWACRMCETWRWMWGQRCKQRICDWQSQVVAQRSWHSWGGDEWWTYCRRLDNTPSSWGPKGLLPQVSCQLSTSCWWE